MWKHAAISCLFFLFLLTFALPVQAALPDRIVNGHFEYPAPLSFDEPNGGPISGKEAYWTYVCPVNGKQYCDSNKDGRAIPEFDHQYFGWLSNQPAMRGFPAGVVEIQVAASMNGASTGKFAEIVAEDGNYAIYQDIRADGDTVLYWSLLHAPRGTTYTGGDTMNVLIGPPTKETVQPATRTSNNGSGDRVEETMTTIKTSKPNNTAFAPWESYEGRYKVPGAGSQTIRFTFSAGAAGNTNRSGNLIDNVVFEPAHKVVFDSNGGADLGYDPDTRNYSGYFRQGFIVRPGQLLGGRTPTRPGHTFLGWADVKLPAATNQTEFQNYQDLAFQRFAMPNHTVILYALWAKHPTIRFYDGDTLLKSETVAPGGCPTAPEVADTYTHTFHGWSPLMWDAYWQDRDHSVFWSPKYFTLTYEPNPPPDASTEDSDITLSRKSQEQLWGYPWTTMARASKPGYAFLGWFTKPAGGVQVTKDDIVTDHLTVYAHWKPLTYTIRFHPNGEHAGKDPVVTGTMPSIQLEYDQFQKLPKHLYRKTTLVPAEDEGGPEFRKASVFQGWSLDARALKPSYLDEAGVLNLTQTDGDVIDLYAIWDDTPSFVLVDYPDRYFTLEEANGGAITEAELLRTVVVQDRETNPIPARPGGGTGPGITVVNYDPADFQNLTDDGAVSVRYRVEDGSGNVGYLNILVYVSRNGWMDEDLVSYFRCISDQYLAGLSPESRWRMEQDPTYAASLARAFGSTKTHDLRLTKAQMDAVRDYVEAQGLGNSQRPDALSRLWETLD